MRDIVIWGAGEYGRRIKRILCNIYSDRKIVFTDSNYEKIGKYIDGTEVVSIDDIETSICDFYTGGKYTEEIIGLLQSKGVKSKNIYVYSPQITTIGEKNGKHFITKECLEKRDNLLVYSIGIGEDSSFDNEIINKYKGQVFAFDPTPKAIDYVNKSGLMESPLFRFFNYGISSKNDIQKFYLPDNKEHVSGSIIQHELLNKNDVIEVNMKSLITVIKELKHDKIDIIKMDIEGAEFDVLQKFFEDQKENIFDYLCIETHERFFENPKRVLDGFIQLLNKKGYIDIYRECDEYLFVEKSLIKNLKIFNCFTEIVR